MVELGANVVDVLDVISYGGVHGSKLPPGNMFFLTARGSIEILAPSSTKEARASSSAVAENATIGMRA